MNLRVDLILEHEKRSASLLNIKSVMRISVIVVPVIIVAVIIFGVISVMHSKLQLQNKSKSWEIVEQKQIEAQDLRNEVAINNLIRNDLLGWKASHMDWHSQLLGLQRVAPRNMQFTKLRVNQTLQLVKNKYPSRYFVLNLSGKSKGADAEANINEFIASIKNNDIFTLPMEQVSIKDFGEDKDENANRQDRVFEIECIYKAKDFQEPKK